MAISPSSKPFALQIAAFKKQTDAKSHAAALKKKGVSANIVQAENDGKTWYRVFSESFATREEALRYQAKLKQMNIDSFIKNIK